jgi:hypothetical protein
MAVVEHDVTAYTGGNQDTSFRNVVLDMLPGPQGFLLGNEWGKNETETGTFSWDYPDYVEDIEDLGVVAFVQERDPEKGEILQAAIKYRTPHVGVGDRKELTGSMLLYPNPTRDFVFVRMNRNLSNRGYLKIMDISGKEVMTSSVHPGYDIQRLDLSGLPQGVYLIYYVDSGIVKARNKLIRTY